MSSTCRVSSVNTSFGPIGVPVHLSVASIDVKVLRNTSVSACVYAITSFLVYSSVQQSLLPSDRSSRHRVMRVHFRVVFASVFLVSAWGYSNTDDFHLTDDIQTALGSDIQPAQYTLDLAVAEIAHLKHLLQRVLHKTTEADDTYRVALNEHGEVEVPQFIREERARSPETNPGVGLHETSSPLLDSPTPPTVCTDHLNCEPCLAAGCGWCIAGRRCIEDIPWVCRGDHDHVGTVGKHKTCPTLEENRKDHEWRRQLKQGAMKDMGLPDGSYKQSCTDCSFDKETLVLQCLSCTAGDSSQQGPTRLELNTCIPGSPVGNSNGMLACDLIATLSFDEAGKRASARLETRQLEELARIKADASEPIENQQDAEELAKRKEEIERRAQLAGEAGVLGKSHGASYPYETLGLGSSATGKEIKKAYRQLTLLLHPDKNIPLLKELAMTAFRDVVAAYETIGTPDKRAAFDDYGSTNAEDGGFHTYWEYQQSGEKDTRNFYSSHPLITPLNERIWDRRLTGDSIWIIEFYAPWCSACQNFVQSWKGVAEALSQDNIEVGAVNCETSSEICSKWFDVPSYPTIMVLNQKHGTQQIYHGNRDVPSLSAWARQTATEWVYLFANANVAHINSTSFVPTVVNSTEFWVVCFLDGLECSSCKTASTNMLRLGAALKGMARIGLVDCSRKEETEFCYQKQGIPHAPHPAVVKVWGRGEKYDQSDSNQGEVLYNSNELEPHLALQVTERSVRLALASEVVGEGALSSGQASDFEADKKEQSPPPPPPPPPPQWNGPKRAAPLPWDGSGGGGRRRMQVTRV